jgi:hypothetical protein
MELVELRRANMPVLTDAFNSLLNGKRFTFSIKYLQRVGPLELPDSSCDGCVLRWPVWFAVTNSLEQPWEQSMVFASFFHMHGAVQAVILHPTIYRVGGDDSHTSFLVEDNQICIRVSNENGSRLMTFHVI